MKSPQQLADALARQWQRADWREQLLLPGTRQPVWPLHLSIGQPRTATFLNDSASLRQHLQQWQAVASSGIGTVAWQARSYRGGGAPVQVPTHWVLARPSDCVAAIARWGGSAGAAVQADYQGLREVLAQVDATFHRLLLRRLALWRGAEIHQVVTATRIALQLAPGCAQGKPLRALALDGNDSKFFERHASLLTALLDVRFDGEASAQGLTAFLGASPEGEHWLLVAPLAPGLLPFARQRVSASELATTPLAASHILLVENERSLHQLPQPLADTIAILGAGLNLGWLAAPWLQSRQVAYWGDIDTWGLAMLATARGHLPHLHPLLMDRATFDAHAHLAVPEPMHASPVNDNPTPSGAWLPDEAALDQHLRQQARGRLEQEFVPPDVVALAVGSWLPTTPTPTGQTDPPGR
jgi:hypothetical protein